MSTSNFSMLPGIDSIKNGCCAKYLQKTAGEEEKLQKKTEEVAGRALGSFLLEKEKLLGLTGYQKTVCESSLPKHESQIGESCYLSPGCDKLSHVVKREKDKKKI